MKFRLASVAIILVPVLCLAAGPRIQPREVEDQDVDRVIEEIKRYLYQAQGKSGGWPIHYKAGQPGGTTAIALFALLEAGERPEKDQIKAGLDALIAVNTNDLYVIAVRTMVLSQVLRAGGATPEYHERLKKDVAWLTNNALAQGAWGYRGPERNGDNSCSQFALLALWEADRAGVPVEGGLLRIVEQTWLRRQRGDGGWTYAGQSQVNTPSTVSMTAAGLASIFICQDVLNYASGPYRNQANVDKAWDYLAAGLAENYWKDGYLAFCVQRVGLASGRKFIGDMDWFAVAAAELCKPTPAGRPYSGNWGPVVRASFELIFLARGRIPLTFNKLQYGQEHAWNWHSRDLPRFNEYMRQAFETSMRWQVVKITDDIRIMLDAPILLISGNLAPAFTDEQWGKLRDYSLSGGMLVFMPVGGSKAFIESAKAAMEKLYAEQRSAAGAHYTMERLDAGHPLYAEYVRQPNVAERIPLWGLSDGTRLISLICERDLPDAWHQRATKTRPAEHAVGAALVFYASGGNSLRSRLRPVFGEQSRQTRQTAKVAWLRHGGNWCTQPFALNYLAQKLNVENRLCMEVTAGVPIEAQALAGHHLAWMTGSDAFSLTEEELSALRQYVQSGGTLFVNAVGGSSDFDRSARQMLKQLFEGQAVVSGSATLDSPLMTGKAGDFRGPKIEAPDRTTLLRRHLPKAEPPLTLYAADRILAIYGRHGIHDTLDGHTAHGALSYMPQSARDIAANVVLLAAANELPAAPVSTTAPATAPATSATAPSIGPAMQVTAAEDAPAQPVGVKPDRTGESLAGQD